jgi:ketosteroid isomerase-like protein
MMLALLSLFLILGPAADLHSSWGRLVEAEQAFARTSVEKGAQAAFLSVLADDSTIFRPRAVPGKKWMQENPAAGGQLNWAPEFADIAASGDLGYTTGPWEFRRNPQDAATAFGHYVTLWRKGNDGIWKVELDIGIGHEQTTRPNRVGSPSIPKEVAAAQAASDVDKARATLVRNDVDASISLPAFLASDARLYRDGSMPMIGIAAARTWLSTHAMDVKPQQIGVKISAAADLGYTFGTTPTFNYLRIWKKQRDGSWKIVLDLMSPVPAGAN